MGISIIIPTFDNVEFLEDLFSSILKNTQTIPFEVLVGIDACENTKKYISNKKFANNFYFYYFLKNEGPYKIKNTLAELSRYDRLFFFDSDDIMKENCIYEIYNSLNKYDCIKPKFDNFKILQNKMNFENLPNQYGEGVFGIEKKIFLAMNGFEGWKCVADSDFMGRIYKSGIKVGLTQEILFYRRIHDKSLTKRSDTGYASELRRKYFDISKNKKNLGPLPFLDKNDYEILNVETYEWSKPISTQNKEIIDQEIEIKRKKHDLLEKLFNGSPKEIQNKISRTINYSTINHQSQKKTQSDITQALKKARLEEIRKKTRR